MTGIDRADGEGHERARGGAPWRPELVWIEPELLAHEHVERGVGVLEDPVGDPGGLIRREPLRPVRGGELGLLLFRHRLHLRPFERDLAFEQLALALHRDVLAGGHAEGSRKEPCYPGKEHESRIARGGARDAHDQRQVAHEAVADAEDDRAERSRPTPRTMPALPLPDLGGIRRPSRDGDAIPPCLADRARRLPGPGARAGRAAVLLEAVPDLRVLALVGRDRRDLGRTSLRLVGVLLVTLEGLDQLGDGGGPEQPCCEDDEPDAQPRPVRRRDRGAELGEPLRPDIRMSTLVGGDPAERVGAPRVLLDAGQRVVQDDRVAFQLEVVETLLDVDRGHGVIVGHRRARGPA